jgi:arsenical pump membrane protein
MSQATALSVVALTVGLSLGRPRIGPLHIHHAEAAVIGALLTMVLGVAPPGALVTAGRLLAEPVATIVSLMIITQIAERSGLFHQFGAMLARQAKGSGRRLFAYLFFAGTLAGTVFTNDAAVLIFTPIVFAIVERIGGSVWTPEEKLPFYFAVLYVANLVGALVIANPINLVMANLLQIGFVEFAVWMTGPALVSIAVSFCGLWLVFASRIPRRFAQEPLPSAGGTTAAQVLCAIALLATLMGFFTQPVTGIPTWAVAVTGAAALLVMHATVGRGAIPDIVRGVAWDVIVFMAGMFVIGLALRHVGVTHVLGNAITTVSGGSMAAMRALVGTVAGVSSALINNHPTADLAAFMIRDLSLAPQEKKLLAFASLIGGDLGPKMLPIGSLAALIWFRLLAARGVKVPYGMYIRIGVPVTLAALAAALIALELQVRLAGLLG